MNTLMLLLKAVGIVIPLIKQAFNLFLYIRDKWRKRNGRTNSE